MLLKLTGIIVLIIGIIIGVFLSMNPQILKSQANGGTLLSRFLSSFGSNFEEERYDSSLDINADGVINIFDILQSRKLDQQEDLQTDLNELEETTDDDGTVPLN
jgi:hypothetical protein